MLAKSNKLMKLNAELDDFFTFAQFKLEPLHSGASPRKYYRIRFIQPHYFPSKEIILMEIPKSHITIMDDYLTIGYYLKRHGITTPQIYEINREKGWIFTAPGSGELVSNYWKKKPADSEGLYSALVDLLIEIQNKAISENHCPAFNRFFDEEKYLYEFQFHVKEQLIGHFFNYSMKRVENDHFKFFAEKISKLLHSNNKLFVHRDFQSSNIFYNIKNPKNPFQIIDFQDARSGIPVYDLVSLLWDSYVKLGRHIRQKLVYKYYHQQKFIKNMYNKDEYIQLIHYAIIQRKLHDAGAFVYCWKKQGNTKYIPYISAAVQVAIKTMDLFTDFKCISTIFKKLMNKNAP